METSGYCSSNCRRFRAREVAGSGGKERGRRGDSVPYLTYHGDVSWWSNFAGEAAPAGLFCSWVALPFMACSGGAGQGQEGEEAGAHGAAQEQGAGAWGEGSGGRLLAWLQETWGAALRLRTGRGKAARQGWQHPVVHELEHQARGAQRGSGDAQAQGTAAQQGHAGLGLQRAGGGRGCTGG
jgi:hypothetical protein